MWIKKEDLDLLAEKKLSTGQEMWDFLVSEKKSKVSIINIIASILIMIAFMILNAVSVDENSLIMFMVSIFVMLSYMVICFLNINDKRSFIANITELIIVLLCVYVINASLGMIHFIPFDNVEDLFVAKILDNLHIGTTLVGIAISIFLFIKNKNNFLVSLIYLMIVQMIIKLFIENFEMKTEEQFYLTYYIGLFSIFVTLISKIGFLENYTQTLTSVAFSIALFMFKDSEMLINLLCIIFLTINIFVWKDMLFTKIAYSALFINVIDYFDFDSIELIILMVVSIAYAVRNKDLKLITFFSFILLIVIDNYFRLEFIEQVFYYMLAGLTLLVTNYIYRKRINKKEQ